VLGIGLATVASGPLSANFPPGSNLYSYATCEMKPA